MLAGVGTAPPSVIEYLARHAPTQQIYYTENTLDYFLSLMRRRELDLVVCLLESVVLTAGFTFTELYSDEILVVAPKNHPLHRQSHITWCGAAAWLWIMP